jgi:hypothetical protein
MISCEEQPTHAVHFTTLLSTFEAMSNSNPKRLRHGERVQSCCNDEVASSQVRLKFRPEGIHA